jgi:hypothetical protein
VSHFRTIRTIRTRTYFLFFWKLGIGAGVEWSGIVEKAVEFLRVVKG